MDIEKCEICPKKDECDTYKLRSFINSISDYEIEPVIIPSPGDSRSKEYSPIDAFGDFVHSLFEKSPSGKINVHDLPMLSLEENPNHMPLKGRKFKPIDHRIERAVQFWKEILIEETDKDLVVASIEALQYLLPDSDVIEIIRENKNNNLNGVFEKCRKMKIKGFKVNTKV